MQRTTINLDEAIYRRVRILAQKKGKSMARVIEDLLRVALRRPGQDAAVEVPLHRDNGARAGVDIADRDRLYALMDE